MKSCKVLLVVLLLSAGEKLAASESLAGELVAAARCFFAVANSVVSLRFCRFCRARLRRFADNFGCSCGAFLWPPVTGGVNGIFGRDLVSG